MISQRWKYLLPCLILAIPAGLNAQGPRSGFFPWWDSPMASGLDLTDTQRSQIRSVIREYRGRMLEVRNAVQKAETELDEVFNEDTVDPRRGSEAIDRLTKARADMTQSVSEMSLRMRAVLTTQQWQELRQREQASRRDRLENAGQGSGSQRGAGRGHRGTKGVAKSGTRDLPPHAESPSQPPALSQQ
jgi:Spy/CpxP family protein refolding chaperone